MVQVHSFTVNYYVAVLRELLDMEGYKPSRCDKYAASFVGGDDNPGRDIF